MDPITSEPVVVTGATGFIAGHLIELLLMKGYRVRSTVRDLKRKEKFDYLTSLPGAAEKLELFEADLMNIASFESCFEGSVEYVLHVASPYIVDVENPQLDLVDPAVNGTVGILELCKKHPTVKRVVVTSSIAALTDSFDSSKTYNEDDWNTLSSLKRNPYFFSKAEAEKAAYNFVKTNEVSYNLVTILPGCVLGPHLGVALNESHGTVLSYLTGEIPVIPDFSFAYSDVRDIACAHIVAMENPAADGRYICATEPHHLTECLEFIKETFPELASKVPTRRPPNWFVSNYTQMTADQGSADYVKYNLGRVPHFDNSRAKSIGIPFRPWQVSVRDSVSFFQRIRAVEEDWGHEAACVLCSVAFTIFTREHHCRQCKRSVCAACSPGKKTFPSLKPAPPKRVCNECAPRKKE